MRLWSMAATSGGAGELDWARSSRGVRRMVAAWEQKVRRFVVIVTRPYGRKSTTIAGAETSAGDLRRRGIRLCGACLLSAIPDPRVGLPGFRCLVRFGGRPIGASVCARRAGGFHFGCAGAGAGWLFAGGND